MSEPKGIMIVEDEMLLSLVYENYIKKMGWKTLGKFVDGKSAIQGVKDLNPDLILMDIFLKGDLDGIDTMKQIRGFSNAPVIYITGNSDHHHAERAKDTGYVDYLIKPITLDDLKTAVAKLEQES